MNELLEVLADLRPDIDFETETDLIDDGTLGSFDVVSIVTALNDTFDIEIKPTDLIPDNFNSAQAMFELVTRLQDE